MTLFQINGPVIVDYKLGYQYNPDWEPDTPWTLLVDHLKNIRGERVPPQRDYPYTPQCRKAISHSIFEQWDESEFQQNNSAEKTIRLVRETLDDLQIPHSRDVQRFKDLQETMDKFKYTELLPGYANAYVLRTRGWSELKAQAALA